MAVDTPEPRWHARLQFAPEPVLAEGMSPVIGCAGLCYPSAGVLRPVPSPWRSAVRMRRSRMMTAEDIRTLRIPRCSGLRTRAGMLRWAARPARD
jgi:hypothetical protein